jgi:3'(2'), 5'-bisphosphate nucleotidase
MIDQSELRKLLSTAINASVKAGKLIMDVYNSNDFHVNLKSDKTPLTLADRQAHTEIANSLSKTRIPSLSEEGRNILYEERKGWEYFWLVDPLDGTKDFIKRNGEFTVNIALIINGYPILGVVYVPVSGNLYFALQPEGSYKVTSIEPTLSPNLKYNELISIGTKLPLENKHNILTVVGSRSHMNHETEEYIASLQKEYGNINTINCASSLKMCMVAEGTADIYPRFNSMWEWDTAAGQAIVEGAGCYAISAETNQRLVYNKEDLHNPWFIVKAKQNIG